MLNTSPLACPKCGAPSLHLVLKTSWGEYYGCAPCHWSIFAADRREASASGAGAASFAALPNATAASGHNTASA
jgi:hypothetical protein